MVLHSSLRTIDLARAAGISVQQVRNYEALGLLPPAERSKSGYRLYTQRHLAALKTARSLVPGYGWQRTPAIMQALHRGDLGVALATIDARHAELAGKRRECEQTLSALHALAAQPAPTQSSRHPQRLRVVVLLREAGYDFNVIRSVLAEMAAGRPEKAIVAVEKRREELTRTSWVCIEALSHFQRYVSEFCGELL